MLITKKYYIILLIHIVAVSVFLGFGYLGRPYVVSVVYYLRGVDFAIEAMQSFWHDWIMILYTMHVFFLIAIHLTEKDLFRK